MPVNYRPFDPIEHDNRGLGARLADTFGAAPAASKPDRWPEPKPLPAGLRPVQAFDRDLLPESIAPWVFDIADRMQCPPDFVAVPALVALGSVIGRKLAIRPQRRTDWCEVANLWGCIVGRPGAMKSPAISEALKPLHRAERAAREIYEAEAQEYALAMEAYKISKEGLTAKARAAVKTGGAIDPMDLAVNEPAEPVARRYVVNDTSYEALGERGAAAVRGNAACARKPPLEIQKADSGPRADKPPRGRRGWACERNRDHARAGDGRISRKPCGALLQRRNGSRDFGCKGDPRAHSQGRSSGRVSRPSAVADC